MAARCSVTSVTAGGGGGREAGFRCADGIRTLAETGRFKAWFLDQFGVLHDGKKPYPGAISTLEKLANHGAKMVIISNSSRRASTTMEKMESLGFDSSLFLGAITSGELTHQHIQRRDDSWFAELGRSCIHMTWSDRGAISLEGLGLQVVSNVDDADFVLAHGTEALGLPSGEALPTNFKELEQILELCAKRKLPMVVANPDFVTVEARDLRVMPGTLGTTYEKLGGEVKWMGKPDKVLAAYPSLSCNLRHDCRPPSLHHCNSSTTRSTTRSHLHHNTTILILTALSLPRKARHRWSSLDHHTSLIRMPKPEYTWPNRPPIPDFKRPIFCGV